MYEDEEVPYNVEWEAQESFCWSKDRNVNLVLCICFVGIYFKGICDCLRRQFVLIYPTKVSLDNLEARMAMS